MFVFFFVFVFFFLFLFSFTCAFTQLAIVQRKAHTAVKLFISSHSALHSVGCDFSFSIYFMYNINIFEHTQDMCFYYITILYNGIQKKVN